MGQLLKTNLLHLMQQGEKLSLRQEIQLCIQLSIPAMLAQVSTVVMEYADAAMVGAMGAEATASIGLVSSTTWLFGGMISAAAVGFTVQTAQLLGGRRQKEARNLMKEGVLTALMISIFLTVITTLISGKLPMWLSTQETLYRNASRYFLIYSLSLPMLEMSCISGGMLQASGDMRTPGILNILCCVMNVIFNALLIFPSGHFCMPGTGLPIWGAGLGVAGAALGTALSETLTGLLMLGMLLFRSNELKLRRGEKVVFHKEELIRSVKIAVPVGIGSFLMSGAYIVSTKIVAPLGTAEVAAHSLSITAESLCYMPGYGVAEAASTLVGQCIGAGNKRLAAKMGWLCTALGVGFMTVTGGLMFVFAPLMMRSLTPVAAVQALGVGVLRIEAFAEPFYAASIVANGVFRGAGDTLAASCMNFCSMWCVRLPLSAFLAARYSLTGVWVAMCAELVFRGLIFLIRLKGGRWQQAILKKDSDR